VAITIVSAPDCPRLFYKPCQTGRDNPGWPRML